MKQTAVEWLVEQLKDLNTPRTWVQIINQAKEMEKEQSHKYAEFAVICDRKNLPVLEFDGFIEL
jgi:hypothetical protein